MPVYEHYCPDCHTIFSFFSRRVDTDTRPACPRCARPNLERQVSLFAISKARAEKEGGGEEGDLALPAGLDMATQKTYLVISALGEDHPGIVNHLSKAILEHGCNIEDSRMTVLGGEFAAMLLVEGKWNTLAKIENALPELERSSG
jgi:putative FmdB family regulatory protein